MLHANVLQTKRKALGLTVYKLSMDTGVSRRTIDRYEASDLPSAQTTEITKLLERLYPDREERRLAKQELMHEIAAAKKGIIDKRKQRKMLTYISKSYRAEIALIAYPITPADKDPMAGMKYRKPEALIQIFEGKGKVGKPVCELHSSSGITFFYNQKKAAKGNDALRLLMDFCSKRRMEAADMLKYMSITLKSDTKFDPDTYQQDENVFVTTRQLEHIRLTTALAGLHLGGKRLTKNNSEQWGTILLKTEKFIARLIDQPKEVVQLKANILREIDALIDKIPSLQ